MTEGTEVFPRGSLQDDDSESAFFLGHPVFVGAKRAKVVKFSIRRLKAN